MIDIILDIFSRVIDVALAIYDPIARLVVGRWSEEKRNKEGA
jgi:hypothetical protein